MRRNHGWISISPLVLLAIVSLAAAKPGEGQVKAPPSAQSSSLDLPYGQAEFEARREEFRVARMLLLDAGLNFDPDFLLLRGWSRLLVNELADVDGLRKGSRLTAGAKIQGVYISETLLLPASVDLTGETIILARRVIFDSASPVIRTHRYGFHLFPINEIRHNDPSYPPTKFANFTITEGDPPPSRKRSIRFLEDGGPGSAGHAGSNGSHGANASDAGPGANGSCTGDKNGRPDRWVMSAEMVAPEAMAKAEDLVPTRRASISPSLHVFQVP